METVRIYFFPLLCELIHVRGKRGFRIDIVQEGGARLLGKRFIVSERSRKNKEKHHLKKQVM